MSTSIYDQHSKHTARITACAILRNGEHVANVTIAHPKNGAGRLYAYAHWIGTEMVRGHANGYGYDKRTAALSVAARAMVKAKPTSQMDNNELRFWEALEADDGRDWADQLRSVGFQVCSVC